MIQGTSGLGDETSALRETFEAELDLLAKAEWARGGVPGVVRLRALNEISCLLDTDTLVTLAAAVAKATGERRAKVQLQ